MDYSEAGDRVGIGHESMLNRHDDGLSGQNRCEYKRDLHVKTIYFMVRTCILITNTIRRTWSYILKKCRETLM